MTLYTADGNLHYDVEIVSPDAGPNETWAVVTPRDAEPSVGLQARVSLPSREDCEIGAFNGEMTTLEHFLWEWTPDTEPEATSFRDALAEVLNERRAG